MYSYGEKVLQNDPERSLLVACLAYSSYSEDGGSTTLWNVGKILPNYAVSHPRR
jgi:hypothetical protein